MVIIAVLKAQLNEQYRVRLRPQLTLPFITFVPEHLFHFLLLLIFGVVGVS